MKILIWGYSKSAALWLHYFEPETILGYVISHKEEEFFNQKPVYSPKELSGIDFDFCFVASQSTEAISVTILKNNLDINKFVFSSPIRSSVYNKLNTHEKWIKENKSDLWNQIKSKERIIVNRCENDSSDSKMALDTLNIPEMSYTYDYFRFRTFEKIADYINARKLIGDVAEVGVFQGVFAALMNRKFPEKKLWLFDSFEGFIPEEAQKELQKKHTSKEFIEHFKNTSVDHVMSRMEYADKIEIVKGFFPNSATGLEDLSFCFASLDVDFEDSMFKCLEWFYPRLCEGGILMIHDGNAIAIKNAVNRYEKELEKNLLYIPLADVCGTYVVIKP